MALKKSELYSSLWSSCDELRGGMDASQYKDYVLVLLFIKYVSDKYAGQPFAPIKIPDGASFKDMVALKGKTAIGDGASQQNDVERPSWSGSWPKTRYLGALVSRASSIRGSKVDRAMGKALRSKGPTFLCSKDENAMGKLQSNNHQHSLEHRLGQKAHSVP
jgi:hypothetical protein